MQSFLKVRDWLLQGKPGKTLRVIAHTRPLAQGSDGKAALPSVDDTRFVLAHQNGFNQQSFETRITELTASGAIKQPLTVTPQDFPGRWADLASGVPHLEATVTITGPAGVQGTLQVFGIKADHFDVRNKTMGALIANGASGDPNLFNPDAKPGATPGTAK